MLWICLGLLGYKFSFYCIFELIKVFFLLKKKKLVKKNKFILYICECRYDNNMNKVGKLFFFVQINRNINNFFFILIFKFCIRFVDFFLVVKYKFYWCVISIRSLNFIFCQYNFMFFYQYLKLLMKNDLIMFWREMVFGKNW